MKIECGQVKNQKKYLPYKKKWNLVGRDKQVGVWESGHHKEGPGIDSRTGTIYDLCGLFLSKRRPGFRGPWRLGFLHGRCWCVPLYLILSPNYYSLLSFSLSLSQQPKRVWPKLPLLCFFYTLIFDLQSFFLMIKCMYVCIEIILIY